MSRSTVLGVVLLGLLTIFVLVLHSHPSGPPTINLPAPDGMVNVLQSMLAWIQHVGIAFALLVIVIGVLVEISPWHLAHGRHIWTRGVALLVLLVIGFPTALWLLDHLSAAQVGGVVAQIWTFLTSVAGPSAPVVLVLLAIGAFLVMRVVRSARGR